MDKLISNAITYVKELLKGEHTGHDFEHTMRVYKTALNLAEEEKADKTYVALAALLHDVDDRKISPQTCEHKDNAVKFMKTQGLDDAQIERICHIIDQISFSSGTDVPDSIEGRCVQDADRLDAMGAIGIARTFAYGGANNRVIYDPEIPPALNMTKEEYKKHQSSSLNHFYEKLFLLKDLMTTDSGKKLAQHRDEFMHAYVDEFLREWKSEDFQL